MLDAILKAGAELAVVEAPALIAGEWAADSSFAERTGPYLRRVVSRAPVPGPDDVGRAIGYARDAARVVAGLAPATRADVLDRASAAATERRESLARLLALELGKPLKDGLGEIDRVADTLAVCAAEARQIGGELLPVAGWARGVGNTALTYRAPAGVALAITPFNAPANLLAHKLGASFAAGNTTIVKAPPQAPAASAAVVALLLEAGMPAEAVQLLHGGGDVGAALWPLTRSVWSASPAVSRPVRRSREPPGLSAWCSNWAATRPRSSATMPMPPRRPEHARVLGNELRPELYLGPAGVRSPVAARRVPR